MTRKGEADYYTGRAETELRLGDSCLNSTVAAVHYELAFRYSLIAAQSSVDRPALRLVVSNDRPVIRPARNLPNRAVW